MDTHNCQNPVIAAYLYPPTPLNPNRSRDDDFIVHANHATTDEYLTAVSAFPSFGSVLWLLFYSYHSRFRYTYACVCNVFASKSAAKIMIFFDICKYFVNNHKKICILHAKEVVSQKNERSPAGCKASFRVERAGYWGSIPSPAWPPSFIPPGPLICAVINAQASVFITSVEGVI